MQKWMRRRRRIVAGGMVSGAMIAALALAAPAAQAQTKPAANHVLIGSGSSTDYTMMQAMDTLFNDSLGCYMTQPSTETQTLDFSCAKNNEGNQVGQGYTENPLNDISVQEAALGSSAGINQLEYGGTGNDGDPGIGGTADPTAVINYARSSRQFKATDYPGLNFVGYATDGVSWLTFPIVNGKHTATYGLKSLTSTDLVNIWTRKWTNWDQIPGAKLPSANICLYDAQLSSGTEATWTTFILGKTGTPADLNNYINEISKVPTGCKSPKGESYGDSHTIFENEGQQIVENGDEANAIFFFSWGKYQVVCKVRTSRCDNGLPSTGSKETVPNLGEINGVTASVSTILCSPCTTPFPVTRDLFNVYSNGSFSSNSTYGFPAATPATLNYVSEVGFICKPQINTKGGKIIDPSTGIWYHTEIANIISSQGFIPFGLQKHEDVGVGIAPASTMLKEDGTSNDANVYAANDPIVGAGASKNYSETDPEGYCQVYTTDENASPAG